MVSDGFLFTVSNNCTEIQGNSTAKVFEIKERIVEVCSREYKNVQELKMIPNNDYSLFIISAHQYQDKTGKSYYGREKIFRYNYDDKVFDEIHTYYGVIHNLDLGHCSKEMVAISGKMPAHVVFYNDKSRASYLISHDYKNRVYISPNERFAAIGGFGSLNGKVEIWDIKKKELIGQCISSYSSFLKWNDKSKKFITAIIYDKLKTDHRLSVYSTEGKQLKRINFKVFDIINADFVPLQDKENKVDYKKIVKKVEKLGLLGILPDKSGPITDQVIIGKNPKKKKRKAKVTVGQPKKQKNYKIPERLKRGK